MKRHTRTIFASTILIMSMLACNMAGNAQPLSVNDQAATIIAATLQEGLRNGADVPITATFSSTPNPTVASTSTRGPTATITPTYSVPMLTVREQTNCRTGPGENYQVVFTYLQNKKLEVIGKYDAGNFWLVKSSESPTGECWLWGEYVDVVGSYWVVASVTAPPTITAAPPAAPSIQKWDFFCSTVSGEMEVTISWTDRASDEAGYRVIRDEGVVAQLPANSANYTETILLSSGESVTYYIEVYNSAGSVRSTPIKLAC
jgi:hypothetical protein